MSCPGLLLHWQSAYFQFTHINARLLYCWHLIACAVKKHCPIFSVSVVLLSSISGKAVKKSKQGTMTTMILYVGTWHWIIIQTSMQHTCIKANGCNTHPSVHSMFWRKYYENYGSSHEDKQYAKSNCLNRIFSDRIFSVMEAWRSQRESKLICLLLLVYKAY